MSEMLMKAIAYLRSFGKSVQAADVQGHIADGKETTIGQVISYVDQRSFTLPSRSGIPMSPHEANLMIQDQLGIAPLKGANND